MPPNSSHSQSNGNGNQQLALDGSNGRSNAAGGGNAADGENQPLAGFSSGAVSTPNGILTLSWGLDALPHKLKVRKVIDCWPLQIKMGGEYNVKDRNFTATAECHDSVLGGEFSLDVLHKSVEYAKRFDLGGVSQLALKGRCNLGEGQERWDASFGFVIEPKASAGPLGVTTQVSNTTKGFDVTTEIPLSKLVSAELCGHLSLPLPTAEFTAHTRGGKRLTVGRHGNVTAHVAQVNAIVNL